MASARMAPPMPSATSTISGGMRVGQDVAEPGCRACGAADAERGLHEFSVAQAEEFGRESCGRWPAIRTGPSIRMMVIRFKLGIRFPASVPTTMMPNSRTTARMTTNTGDHHEELGRAQ